MIKPIYVIHGENEYSKRNKIIELAKEFNFSIKKIDGEKTIKELLIILKTPSLFEKNIIYLYEYESVLYEKNFNNIIEEYFKNPSPTSSLILFFNKKIKSKKMLPDIFHKKNLIYEFNLISNKNIEKWIKEYFKNKNYEINEETCIFLIEKLGCNQIILSNEIEKIILLELKNKVIDINNIKNIISSNIQSNIFQLIDELLSQKTEKMIKSFNYLLDSNESEIKILFMIIREFRLLLITKYYILKNKNENFLLSILNMHPFIVNKLYKKALKINFVLIKNYLIKFYQLEEKIKSYNNNTKILLLVTLLNYIIDSKKN